MKVCWDDSVMCEQNCWEQRWFFLTWDEAVLQSELNLIEIFVTVLEKYQVPGLQV